MEKSKEKALAVRSIPFDPESQVTEDRSVGLSTEVGERSGVGKSQWVPVMDLTGVLALGGLDGFDLDLIEGLDSDFYENSLQMV